MMLVEAVASAFSIIKYVTWDTLQRIKVSGRSTTEIFDSV